MPSVTNANNASICCGCFPHKHGITGNSYFDVTAGHEEYMEAADLLLAPTLFERAAKFGVSSALLSSKKKTMSPLPDNYRSHGSRYELDIPLIIFNSTEAPSKSYFKHNLDLTRWLYRA
jgi:predicted AlkP superfamily pyrophosphatase or phosphodiesterase